MKRIFTFIAALAMVIVCITLLPTEAQAEQYTDGTFVYQTMSYGVSIIRCDKNVSGDVVIPEYAYINDTKAYYVTGISGSAFDGCDKITSITIPRKMSSISGDAFKDCTKLSGIYTEVDNVHYAGSKNQWNTISVGAFNDCLSDTTLHFAINCNNGHTWSNSEVTKEPTCKEEGIKTYTCTVCGETKTETIAKLTTHSYDNGKVTKEATCKEEGEKTYTCSVCKETKTEAIAKLTTHTPGAEATATTPQICTVCGKELKPATGATEPPATEPPATEPPATEPPATEPPATEPPATEPPATEPSATEPSATEPTVTPTQPEGNKNPDDGEFPIMVVIAIVVLGGGGAAAGVILWKKKH